MKSIRKRILCVFLVLTVILSLFCVTISAEDGQAAEKDLLAEIKENVSTFDETKMTGSKPIIIGAYTNFEEALINGIGADEYFYLYIYSSSEAFKLGSSVVINDLSVEGLEEGNSVAFAEYSSYGTVIKASDDGKYAKAAFPLSFYTSSFYGKDFDTLVFRWSSINIQSNYYIQNNRFEIVKQADGSSNISFEQREVATLDVHYTSYNCAPKDKLSTVRDEIHTVYFSVPDSYKDYYDYIYSVTSTYTKKRTTPMYIVNADFVGPVQNGSSLKWDNPSGGYVPVSAYVSNDFELVSFPVYSDAQPQLLTVPGVYEAHYGSDNVSMATSAHMNGYQILYKEKLPSKFVYKFYSTEDDHKVSSDTLLEFIHTYENDNLKLFESSEYFSESTKTIKETWSSVPYYEKANFWELCEIYGFKIAFKLWSCKDDPVKLQEIANEYPEHNFDFNAFQSMSQPYLVLCDSAFKAEISGLTNQEVSDKYFIALDDVPDFRTYLENNSNVMLYRFDVSERFSVEVNPLGNLSRTDAVVQQYVYFDFSVIDLTFYKDGEYTSLNVMSIPEDFTGDVVAPEAPVPVPGLPAPVEGVKDFFEIVKDAITNNPGAEGFNNLWKAIQEAAGNFLASIRGFLIGIVILVVLLLILKIYSALKRPKIIIKEDKQKKNK